MIRIGLVNMKFNYSSADERHSGFAGFKCSDAPKKAKMERVKLQVQEGYDQDFRHGISWFGRISRRNMQSLGVRKDDVIEIKGQKGGTASGRAAVKCLPLLRSERDMDIIAIDGLVRNNAGVTIGDTVEVKRLDNVPPAIQIVFDPIEILKVPSELMSWQYLNEKFAGAPLAIDNLVLVPYLDGRLTFKIVELYPAEIAVVTEDTDFKFLSGER